jgi:hypothetical protein
MYVEDFKGATGWGRPDTLLRAKGISGAGKDRVPFRARPQRPSQPRRRASQACPPWSSALRWVHRVVTRDVPTTGDRRPPPVRFCAISDPGAAPAGSRCPSPASGAPRMCMVVTPELASGGWVASRPGGPSARILWSVSVSSSSPGPTMWSTRVRKIASHLQPRLTFGEGRRQLTAEIKVSLRELSNQLSRLNHHVGAHVDLKDVDLDYLDLISRDGPVNPRALARRVGLHPPPGRASLRDSNAGLGPVAPLPRPGGSGGGWRWWLGGVETVTVATRWGRPRPQDRAARRRRSSSPRRPSPTHRRVRPPRPSRCRGRRVR